MALLVQQFQGRIRQTKFWSMYHDIHRPATRCVSSKKEPTVEGTIPQGGHGVAVSQYAQVRSIRLLFYVENKNNSSMYILAYHSIQVQRVFTATDVASFGCLVGDNNPLHQTWNFDKLPQELKSHPLLKDLKATDRTDDKTKVMVHGMLASSLFSCIFGTLVPGSVYLKQTLDFKSPVYVDEPVIGRVDIVRVRDFSRKIGGVIVSCDTRISPVATDSGDDCVVGKADVWLPSGSKAKAR